MLNFLFVFFMILAACGASAVFVWVFVANVFANRVSSRKEDHNAPLSLRERNRYLDNLDNDLTSKSKKETRGTQLR